MGSYEPRCGSPTNKDGTCCCDEARADGALEERSRIVTWLRAAGHQSVAQCILGGYHLATTSGAPLVED